MSRLRRIIPAVGFALLCTWSAAALAAPAPRMHLPIVRGRVQSQRAPSAPLSVSRLDQASTYALIRNVQPGGRLEL